jgi:hypothetical protein
VNGHPAPSAASAASWEDDQRRREPWGIAELFIISQTALPGLLFLPGMQAIRLPLRVGAFVISFGLLLWWLFSRHSKTQGDARHPASPWVVAVMVVLGLMIFHPHTTTLTGGVAQIGLYVCVFAPLLWAPALVRTPTRLRRVMAILLVCNGINAAVGVLQVYDPQRWLPDEFSRIMTESELGLGPVTYRGPSGELIVRPPGLFDTPGAVAGPGAYAALLGLIFAATRFHWATRLASLGFAFAGIAAIYLSQVRVSLVIAVGMIVAYGLMLHLQRRHATATLFSTTAAGLLFAAFSFAVLLGGTAVFDRFATLFASDPWSVYQSARGIQLTYAFSDSLFEFPLGAGLARWGMMGAYFGTPTLDSPSLWAEIQVAGWIFDGGAILAALYCAALAAAALREFRLARSAPSPLVAACAAAVLAANLGPIALIFSFTPFATQIGVQYWFLVGALHGVVEQARANAAAPLSERADVAPVA